MADDYAIAVRPVHTSLITLALSVLATLSVRVLLVEDDGTVCELQIEV